jgi:hypothetical protein
MMIEGEVQKSRPPGSQSPRFGGWLGDLKKNEDRLEIKKGRSGSRKRMAREGDEGNSIGNVSSMVTIVFFYEFIYWYL